MRYTVPPELDGARTDVVVARLAGVSRAQARRIAEGGGIAVGGSDPITGATRLRAGTAIEVTLTPKEGLEAEPVAFTVVWEDDHMAVVSKPAGIVVHPGAGVRTGTLAAGFLHRWPQIRGVGEPDRWGVVHRLDKDTSGVLLVAKTRPALDALRAQLKSRAVDRRYAALVHGRLEFATGTIDAPLRRDTANPTRVTVAPDGRPARTHYELATEWARPEVSLVDVRLETGRTHQIRVHLAAIDHPVVGDDVYGTAARAPGARLFLHAASVAWVHPVTGRRRVAQDPLPAELEATLDDLGQPKKARATS